MSKVITYPVHSYIEEAWLHMNHVYAELDAAITQAKKEGKDDWVSRIQLTMGRVGDLQKEISELEKE